MRTEHLCTEPQSQGGGRKEAYFLGGVGANRPRGNGRGLCGPDMSNTIGWGIGIG